MTIVLLVAVGMNLRIIGSEIVAGCTTVVELKVSFEGLIVFFDYTETLDSPDAAVKIPPYQLR